MMAVPLGSLVGSQAVRCPLTPETVDSLHLWTPDRIRALVVAALDRKEAEAERVLQVSAGTTPEAGALRCPRRRVANL